MNARDTRKKLGLNQQTFWSRLGVTQSGGSRYESGRNIPKPVQKLIGIAFGSTKECNKIIEQLRGNTPEDTPDAAPQAHFVAISGKSSTEIEFVSAPVSSFALALADYEGLAVYPYRAIEYRISLTEKYVFQPSHSQLVVR